MQTQMEDVTELDLFDDAGQISLSELREIVAILCKEMQIRIVRGQVSGRIWMQSNCKVALEQRV